MPARLAVGAPADGQCPARQLLAGVPLALAEMQESAAGVLGAQPVHQLGGEAALGGAERVDVPLGAVAVVHRDEGRLAAHRQAHVLALQLRIDVVAQLQDRLPLRLGVGLGHARRFIDARDAHVVLEAHLAFIDRAAHRRGGRRLGRARHRDVAFAGHQAGSRVEPDPAGAGQEDLAPGVQVGEVDLGAARPVQRFDVRLQLDQVTRHEACRQPHVAQRLHQQPAGIAARSRQVGQRQFGRLHARLHADQVADVVLQALVQADQEIDGTNLLARDAVDEGLEARRQRPLDQVRRQVVLEFRRIVEGVVLGLGLEEEVEGVVDRHLGHQVDRDLELGGHIGEDQPRQVVGKGVLLPVDEVLGRLDLERIAEDRRAAVRRRAQPHHLRRQLDAAVVAVVRDVVQRDMD